MVPDGAAGCRSVDAGRGGLYRAAMNDEQRFLFDLQGFLVVPGVLSAAELAALNAIADEKAERYSSPVEDWEKHQCSFWGQPLVDLIDHPKVVPYLLELVGPYFRIDHDYCIVMRQGDQRGGLHGGSHPVHAAGDHWYRYQDGVMRNGLTVFVFNLSDVGQGDGGFACVPGSHKSNFIDKLPPDVRSFERRPPYVVQPPLAAGDLLIFTEALIHGTMPWTAAHERCALLYKYSPGHSTWAQQGYNMSDYAKFELTEQRKRIMQPPSIGGRRPSVQQSAEPPR